MENLEVYLETHYEVVSFIERVMLNSGDSTDNIVTRKHEIGGHSMLYQLAKEWSDEFQDTYKNTDWSEVEWLDTIDTFLKNKLRINYATSFKYRKIR